MRRSGACSSAPNRPIPALLTRTSIGPAAAMAAAMLSSSVTSSGSRRSRAEGSSGAAAGLRIVAITVQPPA
ncbi:hypothetical protein AOA14_03515 [Sphingopyxis terrae subsp. terrae NBRC 15098]|uniref:Uncharacterized protein n=1 Tax=Sphingopyxis terrae subsp. terrae NBRC 15098 TaxID=1219058 RepID=A0A142VV67_9SPHN|nr:hypothetical protein AOA14_03515 [Sphingopyxis terrae subsp. terrae NBRC 15098]